MYCPEQQTGYLLTIWDVNHTYELSSYLEVAQKFSLSLFQYCINSNDWLNLKIEKVSQRQEETYELLLCNDTVVLTI